MTNQLKWPLGQDLIFSRMSECFRVSKLPPVLLFWGKKGIGKSQFIKRLAAMFYCDSKNACGHCPSCHMAFSGSHPDVLVLDEESSVLKVEHAKLVSEHLEYKAPSARLVLISDVDRMTEQGVNRLLKTLEETPPDTYVMMSSSRIDLLLTTLRSRSVKIQIYPPSFEDLKIWANERSLELSDAEFKELAMMAGHSPGLMLDLMERQGSGVFTEVLQQRNPQIILNKLESYVKESGINATDTVNQIEFSLNQIYKQDLEQLWPASGLRERRLALRKVRQMAVKKKVSLNALSAAEGIALATLI